MERAARIAGLGVAGLTLVVRSVEPVGCLGLPVAARPFRRTRPADIRLDLSFEPVPRPAEANLLFDSGAVWRAYRRGRGLLYTFQTPALTPALYKGVAIDRALRRGTLYFPPTTGGTPPRSALDFPLDELLFQHRLAREGGIELHACGIRVAGQALLFCGQSGAGKTTTARLWHRHRPSATILSDDRIVVRRHLEGLRAHGTPWHGEAGYAHPGSAPVGAVCFLRHAPAPRLRPLTAAEAAARLFARTFPPLWDRGAVRRMLATCGRLAAAVPCVEFGFRPDASAVPAALELLRR